MLSNIEFFIICFAFLLIHNLKAGLLGDPRRKTLPNRSIEDDCVVVFFVDVVVIFQHFKLGEVVLRIKFDGCLIVVGYVEIYRKAMLEGLLYQVHCVLKHLGADAQLAALVDDANSHYIACLPLAEEVPGATEKPLFDSLKPALALPSLPVYGTQHVLVFLTLFLYTRHAAAYQD